MINILLIFQIIAICAVFCFVSSLCCYTKRMNIKLEKQAAIISTIDELVATASECTYKFNLYQAAYMQMQFKKALNAASKSNKFELCQTYQCFIDDLDKFINSYREKEYEKEAEA